MVAQSDPRQEKANDIIATSLDAVRKALESLRYGQITLTIHEGKVAQMEVTEKTRFSGK